MQSMMPSSPVQYSSPPVAALVSVHGLLMRPSKVVSVLPEVSVPGGCESGKPCLWGGPKER